MGKTLKVLLYVFAVYHLVLGVFGVFFTGFSFLVEKVIALAFNFNIVLDAQTIWMIKPIAAYMLIMGVISLIAAANPAKNKNLIYALAALMVVRILQRLVFAFQGQDFVINANPVGNYLVIIVLAVYSVYLVWLTKKINA